MSGSRGAVFSLVVSSSMLFYLLFKSRIVKLSGIKQRGVYLVIFIIFSACVLLTPNFLASIRSLSSRIAGIAPSGSSSVQDRVLLARVAGAMIKDRPVEGTGAGGFAYFYQSYQSQLLKTNPGFRFIWSSYAHNDYLQLAAETGLVGLAFFVVFIFTLFTGFDRASSALDSDKYLLCCGFLCSAGGCLIESFFNFPLFILPSAAFFWLSCGFVFFMLPPAKARALPAQYIIAAAFAALTAVSFTLLPGFLSASYLAAAAANSEKHTHTNDFYYNKALKYGPNNYEAWSLMASSCVMSSDYAAALNAYEKALKIRPFSADMIFNMGSINLKLKDYTAAEKYFKQSLDLYPDFAQAHLNLAKTFVEQNHGDEAAAEFAKAISLDREVTAADFKSNIVDFREITGQK